MRQPKMIVFIYSYVYQSKTNGGRSPSSDFQTSIRQWHLPFFRQKNGLHCYGAFQSLCISAITAWWLALANDRSLRTFHISFKVTKSHNFRQFQLWPNLYITSNWNIATITYIGERINHKHRKSKKEAWMGNIGGYQNGLHSDLNLKIHWPTFSCCCLKTLVRFYSYLKTVPVLNLMQMRNIFCLFAVGP